MKMIFSGTLAAFVVGAAIASSQTPSTQSGTKASGASGGQTQSGDRSQGGRTQSGGQTQTAGQRNRANQVTYRGYLRGSAAEGWTITPMANRGTVGTAGSKPGAAAGAEGGASSSSTTTYSVVPATNAKVNLSSMGDQCVEIVGILADAGAGGSTGAGNTRSGGNTAGGNMAGSSMSAHNNRTLQVTTIRAMKGGCTQ